MELVLAALLISNNPYAWEISCQRWHESRAEILMDENLPIWERSRLIRYLRSKVVEPCPDTTFSDDTDELRPNPRAARAERDRLLHVAALRTGA